MKLFRLFIFVVAAIQISSAQEASSGASPNPDATLTYIHAAWDTLTRSMTDCHSLVDTKVTTSPILYMPAELPAPPEVVALKDKCHVEVIPLPRRIEKLGDVRPDELTKEGLLYLPNPYVVPGGRFNEMYGWDS
ncbi:MAG TPA: trehalase family glycosidase, partial [Candidatus Acidoferrum sp.]